MRTGALDKMLPKARRAVEAKAQQQREAIVEAAAAMPGVTVHIEDERVVLEGRGLLDRWLRDASLRNIGRLDL